MHQDWLFYNNLFQMVSWMGITPLWLKTQGSMSLILAMIYPVILALICTILCILLFNQLTEHFNNIMTTILGITGCFIDSTIVSSCVLSSIMKRKNWKLVLQNVKVFYDENYKYQDKPRAWLYRICLSVPVLLLTGIWCPWLFLTGYNNVFLLHIAVSSLSQVATLFHCVSLDYISTGYKLLSCRLKLHIATNRNDGTEYDLRAISIQCRTLYRAVALMNILFGWPMLVITIKSFVIPLNFVNNIFTAYFQNSPASLSTINFCYALTVVVSNSS